MLFLAGNVFASEATITQNYGSSYAPNYNANCYNFTRDLYLGSQGEDVSNLQVALGMQNVTGYFGRGTFLAVRRYQWQNGIRQTGYVSVLTKLSLSRNCYTPYPYPTPTPTPIPTPIPVNPISQITNVSGPNTLNVGTSGTWNITVTAPNYTYTTMSVKWGDENYYASAYAVPQSQYLTGNQTFGFNHTYQRDGVYTVVFTATNQYGQVNTSSVTVNVTSSYYGQVSLYSITPSSSRTGYQVTLQGSGFTQYNNVVHFGNGGTRGLASYNSNTIYFTIPYYVSPCDVIETFVACTAASQQVTPGNYPVYVTNANGTSQTLYFTVTSY